MVNKTSSKYKTKHYLVGFLNLLLGYNNTYLANVRNFTVKNVSKVNVLNWGLKSSPHRKMCVRTFLVLKLQVTVFVENILYTMLLILY